MATAAELAVNGQRNMSDRRETATQQLETLGGTMRKLGTVVALVISMLLVTATLAGAQSTTTKAGSGSPEVGVTRSQIHIAVVADVDSPLSPGLFQGVVDGVDAAAKYLNSKAGGGGVAGRQLVVDFIDSKLNPTTARNAIITACSQDYALVGTAAFFLTNFDDAVNCKDQRGAATGLPDFAAVATSIEGCADISFPINPPPVLCDTVAKSPQTYQANRGAFTYLSRQNKNGLHGPMVYANSTKSGAITGQNLIQGAVRGGIKADATTGVAANAQQSEYTPIIQKMKQDGSNFGYNVTSDSGAVAMQSEAMLQGLDSSKIVWACTTSCYDKTVEASAKIMNGVYVPMSFLPFNESRANAGLAAFLKYVGTGKASGFAVYGWTAALAFAQAARSAAAKAGNDGLTRSALLNGAKTLTSFNAGGMMATTNLANKVSTSCYALVQLNSNAKWNRIYPKKPGTFDCSKSNHFEYQADYENG
jgi:hypothetical protein